MTSDSNNPAEAGAHRLSDDVAASMEMLEQNPNLALNFVETRLPSNPDPELFRIAAEACRRLGLNTDAEDAELSGIQAGFQNPELNAAAIAREDGRHDESYAIVLAFLDIHPDDLLALTMAAEAENGRWQLELAEGRLRTVLKRAPTFLRAIMLLAQCLVLQARLKEGIALIEEVVRRKPNNQASLTYLGELSSEANDHDKASRVYRRVVTLDPGNVSIWIILAQQLRMLARKPESITAFRRALALDPNNGAAWWGLVNYFGSEITSEDARAIERALEVHDGTAEHGGPLHITLGILAERSSNYRDAFEHIAEGKRLQLAAYPYDSLAASAKTDATIQEIDTERFARATGAGCPDNSPVFIIGMPRSGTTLLERILSCHSQVEAGGELPIMPRLQERVQNSTDLPYARRLATMTGSELSQFGERYVARSEDYRVTNKPRFIDKLNSNWMHVGLIRLALPKARIIDLRRNSLDCCWSNFKMLFADGAIASNDQRDIARFYGDYVRMVEAVDDASPGGILNVKYEDLVDDVEGQTRRILDFLSLEFEPQCLDFHLSTSAVATPSSEQVRRPINRQGIGSAEPYRQWLGPMIEELAAQSL
jgi:tetratricopeptide (TPR) repeat protein